MLPLILSMFLSPSLQPPAIMVLLVGNRVEIVPIWLLFELNKYPLEDRKIHISCIKEKNPQNPGLPGSGQYSDHLVPEFYLLPLCQLPLMPWQPSHSFVTTAASSGLAALISLSHLEAHVPHLFTYHPLPGLLWLSQTGDFTNYWGGKRSWRRLVWWWLMGTLC